MTASDKENLVQRTMNIREFLNLFPWSKVVKFYFIFLVYTIVASVVFFSTEQCLSDHKNHDSKSNSMSQNKVQTPAAAQRQNCTTVQTHVGNGIHDHGNKESNNGEKGGVADITKCTPPSEMKTTTTNDIIDGTTKCSLKSMTVMKWIYFTVAHFHGADTLFLHLRSTGGQSVFGPAIVFGIILATRLYTLIGFIGVNLLNFGFRKLRARLRRHRKESLKYEVLLAATALVGLYILFCAGVTTGYARAGVTFQSHSFKWLMLLTTMSDENLIPDSFTEKPQHIAVPIILIFLGYLFTSTFVAAIVNVKHRLTYRVNAKIPPKSTGLKSWWV
ncbi:uncharacterized protein [Clytia hemisphaerica]|uniref:Uncharacterized protein n=1 Tax=Clytia hemisphaerica TaxID=252671 RepID=A0A7M5XLK4_9CNID